MFKWKPDFNFSLTSTQYNDSNCNHIVSQRIIEDSCNYTSQECCEGVQKNYNLTLNTCSNQVVYNCTIINPEDEIIIYILFALCICCICCGTMYVACSLRRASNNVYEHV